MSYRLGVDVGGTFTDLVLVSPDGVARTCKVLSTTANYAEAIIAGVQELTAQAGIAARDIGEIIHGTTVATNRSWSAAARARPPDHRGLPRPARDRPAAPLAALRPRLRTPGVARAPPVAGARSASDDTTAARWLTPLDRDGAARAIDRLLAEGVESIAVCFLHAYANPGPRGPVWAR